MADVSISLTADEALVLFEWIAAREDTVDLSGNPAPEDLALWTIKAALDRQLVEPFMPDYKERVEAARLRLTRPE
jgi:hypothetical protein